MLCKNDNKFTLGEFIIGFMEYSEKIGKTDFPPIPDRRWHELLYAVKERLQEKFPILNFLGRFSWDGSYPELEELYGVAAVIGFITVERFNGRIMLDPLRIKVYSFFQYPELTKSVYQITFEVPGFWEE